MRHRLMLAFALCVSFGPSRMVRAEQSADRAAAGHDARRLFEEGVARAYRRDHEGARQAFTASYDLDPQPDTLFALAQSERLLGRCDAAIPLYERFLEVATRPQELEAARIALGRCRGQAPGPIRPPPPVARPEAPALAQGSPSATPAARSRILPWSLTAGAAIAFGASAALFVLSSNEAGDAPRSDTYGDYVDRGETARLARGFALSAGAIGIAAAAGAAWAFWHDARPARSLDVAAGPASIVLTGCF